MLDTFDKFDFKKAKNRNKKLLALDPGNTQTGVIILENAKSKKILKAGVIENEELLRWIKDNIQSFDICAIEMIASYGMAVGRTVFETCVWIGRFTQVMEDNLIPYEYIFRLEEKILLCGTAKAKDGNIRKVLVEYYGGEQETKKVKCKLCKGKGWKGPGRPVCPECNADPEKMVVTGRLYGVSADAWAALAVAFTYYFKERYNTQSADDVAFTYLIKEERI